MRDSGLRYERQEPMTLFQLTRTVTRGAATSCAVLGIVAASMVGLHEWADAETTRGISQPSAETVAATNTVQASTAEAATAVASPGTRHHSQAGTMVS